MDKLPCSTSFLLTINFDCLKEIIEFFHKNINILNEKINDLNKKFNGFEEVRNQVNENKIKIQANFNLLNEVDDRINNFSQSILKNSEKAYKNEQNIKKLEEEIERLKMNKVSDSNGSNNLSEELKELKEVVEQANYYNKDNIDKLNQKIINIEEKLEKLSENGDSKNNNVNSKENYYINQSDSDKANLDNKIFELSRRIDRMELNLAKLSDNKDNKDNNDYKEISPVDNNEITEIKEKRLNDAGNNYSSGANLEDLFDEKFKELSEKIKELEEEIKNIKSNNNTNIPLIQIPPLNEEENDENKKENEENKSKDESSKDDKSKNSSNNKQLFEIMTQISNLNNILSNDEILRKPEFNKYSHKIELQLKDINDKINKLIQKDSLRNKVLEDMNKNTIMLSNKIKENSSNKSGKEEIKSKDKNDNNYVTYDMLDSLEQKLRELILNYISEIDISTNPSIEELKKNIEENKNTIKELSSKIDEINLTNAKNNDYQIGLINNLKKDVKNNIKKVENEIENISSLQDEIDLLRLLLLGQEESLKFKNMTKEEKINEIQLGTSIKEELNIHGDYLKKLSEGINKLNNRINNLNKETLLLIKKDLKKDSNIILEEFKYGLKDSITRIENQLKDKVDKLGLDEFWKKINEQVIAEMKDKIDKKELNKNNMYLNRKIDILESKISRTLVDTLIDLQMDEAPLLVKKNFRESNAQKCASCGQNLPNNLNMNTIMVSSSSDFNNYGTTHSRMFKQKSTFEKLPDIKQNFPK